MKPATKKVTGIGGIFFKCKNVEKMKKWYGKNLGLATNDYGAVFEFRRADKPKELGVLQWTPFPAKTKYFGPSKKDYMINYRVENLEALVKDLKKSGVRVLDQIETFDFGKFVHVLDLENNKIELWEPVNKVKTRKAKSKSA